MAVAVAFSIAWLKDGVEDGQGEERARGLLAGFRGELYQCLGKRRDVLSEPSTVTSATGSPGSSVTR